MTNKLIKKKKSFLALIHSLGYKKNMFKISFSKNGPQGQFVYAVRFPVSYKNSQLLSQRVNFTNYFDWMGQVREYSLMPISKKIIKLTKSGKWGLATNSVKLSIFDFAKADDVIEARLWLDKISGLKNIYHLSFDWLRFLKDNSYECIARSNIVITCVKILGHGQAVITRPPSFLKTFFNLMKPESVKKKKMKRPNFLFDDANFGRIVAEYKKKPHFLFRTSYQTSLENSNLIGNIYFSNYAKWIDSTKDLFLYNQKPGIFTKVNFIGELATAECKISYSQEAMPFDKVFVKMYVETIYEKAILLKYEIFKEKLNSFNVKLANATQTIRFVKYYKALPRIEAIPSWMLKIFLK